MKNIDGASSCFIEEINQNKLMSKKHEKACTALICIKYSLILASANIECLWIYAFPSLVYNHIGIASFVVGLEICAIIAGIKKHQSIIKKKWNKHEVVLLGKTKLISTKVLISTGLID